ncbi:DivIVA domain-containing protein [Roseisolibacter sp. H3M3-2]|uniref:DivIVA domain-containing protein n=1 Tax=Roseisolibacter sp. H3M3-2 TaxID=3031323 RepID=UPI0023DB4376|nr:DivIVA domain-containing protein [Roseisolibacter sp. H3M3-2]MDF1504399.1 DivIVA domain-containing protein [Roseisolibacter sp. H3M3-2]
MTDETFRLTPLDVRRYDFGAALRGYDKARVETFRDQVAAELERLARANQDLDQKARNFHEQLRAFRDRDRALNDALISAQQIGTQTREAAEREAELIRREARAEADEIRRQAQEDARRHVDELRGEQRRVEEEITGLDRVHRTYIAQLRLLAERQLAELAAAESRTLPPPAPRRAALDAPAGWNDARGDVRGERARDMHPLDASALEALAAELELEVSVSPSPIDPARETEQG